MGKLIFTVECRRSCPCVGVAWRLTDWSARGGSTICLSILLRTNFHSSFKSRFKTVFSQIFAEVLKLQRNKPFLSYVMILPISAGNLPADDPRCSTLDETSPGKAQMLPQPPPQELGSSPLPREGGRAIFPSKRAWVSLCPEEPPLCRKAKGARIARWSC